MTTARGGIRVRPAIPTDAAAFDSVAASGKPGQWAALNVATSRSLLAEASDSDPVGFIEAQQAGDDVEIIMIMTRLSAQRSGIATRMLQRLLADAKAAHASRIILDVAEANTPARCLYEKVGFLEIGRRSNYYPTFALPNRQAVPSDALLLAYHFASGTA